MASAHHAEETRQALQRIYQRTAHGVKLGLDSTRWLFHQLNCPFDPFPIVHVAGTNGKGSTVAMLSSIFHHAGYRVGRFTSPHLVRFNERFVINEQPISDAELAQKIHAVETAALELDEKHPDHPVTFFELCTALAIEWFRDQQVDIAVIETGLGGRLDSTSVLQPVLSVITRIDLDHARWLGDTLEQIAAEKAGILKPQVPLVLGQQPPEAGTVLLQSADELGCPVLRSDTIQISRLKKSQVSINLSSSQDSYGKVTPALPGDFQWENIAAAVTAAEWLSDHGFPNINRSAVRSGLENVSWPGRAQILQEEPLQVLDCAHNPGGMKALLEWVKQKSPTGEIGILFSACADKDLHVMADIITRHVTRVWVCELDTPRTASLDTLTNLFRHTDIPVESGSFSVMRQQAEAWQEKTNATLIIAGSAYLVGMALSLDHLDPGENITADGHR